VNDKALRRASYELERVARHQRALYRLNVDILGGLQRNCFKVLDREIGRDLALDSRRTYSDQDQPKDQKDPSKPQ
jgi:hypothetical protein